METVLHYIVELAATYTGDRRTFEVLEEFSFKVYGNVIILDLNVDINKKSVRGKHTFNMRKNVCFVNLTSTNRNFV